MARAQAHRTVSERDSAPPARGRGRGQASGRGGRASGRGASGALGSQSGGRGASAMLFWGGPRRRLLMRLLQVDSSFNFGVVFFFCGLNFWTYFEDEEINEIKNRIGSAVLDSEVKGGLRWPFGEDSSGSQYAVIAVWHTTAKLYRNSSIRFKLRHADRFDFRSSTGEVAHEASLKMPGIVSQLWEQTIDENLVLKMLEDNLRLIWDHCLTDGSSS